jgi:6-phosphogluconolactonase
LDVELRVAASADAAWRGAAEAIAEAAKRGGHIAVSGGSTPGPTYELAATLAPDWSAVELWFADERCVPHMDERSNYRLVRERLLDRLQREPVVHRVRGEMTAAEAADLYDGELRGVTLDFALLGIGPDGHTASLFPNDPALDELERQAVAVGRADVDRVTLTLPALRGAAEVAFLVIGADKADAIRRAFVEPPGAATPAGLVRSAAGITYAFLDRAAAETLEV